MADEKWSCHDQYPGVIKRVIAPSGAPRPEPRYGVLPYKARSIHMIGKQLSVGHEQTRDRRTTDGASESRNHPSFNMSDPETATKTSKSGVRDEVAQESSSPQQRMSVGAHIR